jgi:hypothetical protein
VVQIASPVSTFLDDGVHLSKPVIVIAQAFVDFVKLSLSLVMTGVHSCEAITAKIAKQGNKCSHEDVRPVIGQTEVEKKQGGIMHGSSILSLI